MKVQHNIPGMNNVNIGKSLNSKMSKALRRLSTGTRVATAADDAAGLAVSEKIRFLISEQGRCIDNTAEGFCVAQTADAALAEVSDMMHRAQQLCMQAKNGTYGEEDRTHITKEINALYDEMERIFDTTRFSSLKLFNADGYNPAGDDSILREYTEVVTDVSQGDPLQSWGELDFVDNKQFELADEAQNAAVTAKLESSVILRDASSLNGKSFTLSRPGQTPVRINFSSSPNAYTGSKSIENGAYNYVIATKNCTTVQDALDLLVERTNSDSFFTDRGYELDPDKTVLNSSSRELTLTFKLDPLVQTINGSTYKTEDAAGAADNAITLGNREQASLAVIDGTDNTDNKTVYSGVGTGTFALLPDLTGTLSDEDIAALTQNTLSLSGGYQIGFTTTGEAGKIDISGKTAEEIRDAILQALNALTDSEGRKACTAVLNDQGLVELSAHNLSTDHYAYSTIRETVPEDADPVIKATNAIPVTVTKTDATGEKGCVFTIGIGDFELPASIAINGRIYSFVQSQAGATVNSMDGYDAYFVSDKQHAIDLIRYRIAGNYPDVTVSVSGSTITATGKYAADNSVSISIAGAADQVKISEVSKKVLMSSSHVYLEPSATIPLDLSQAMSDETALTDLNGKGFGLSISSSNYTYYEFVCAPGTQTNPNTVAIDITGCTSYDDIAAKMQETIPSVHVTHDGSGKLTIEIPRTTSSSNLSDGLAGLDGLFLNSAGEATYDATGGSDATQPKTTIDFSRYNSKNFDELYGKGFRITCATCEGEFINIIFCHDASAAIFPDGKFTDVDSHGNPISYTNYAVELKDMRNGSDIVRNIVDQLKDKLDHFTDVSVGDPSSVLQISDKRAGNIKKDDTILRAEILSGVYTNCTYDVLVTEYVNPDAIIGGPDGSTSAYYGYCPVFVGSDGDDGEWILVHLPNLSLSLLNLDPPRPDLTDVSSIDDVMDRLATAENVIITSRGALGADQNRLEHAQKNLAVSKEQNTASYSTIKDADMAEEMTEQTKLSILQNFQQAALSHIFENASSVLNLLY